MKKLSLFLSVLFAVSTACVAEDVELKDGTVHRGVGLRRDGAFVFAKPEGGQDIVIPVNTIKQIAFRESSNLREAREAFYGGDSRRVLDGVVSEATYHKIWVDIPGAIWNQIMRLRVPAVAASGKVTDMSDLVRDWVPTGDAELEAGYALIKLRASGAGDDELKKAWLSAVESNPGSLASAIAWLELGKAASDSKDWLTAIRHFVSLQVFAPTWRVLHPSALLGAVKASAALNQWEQVTNFCSEMKTDYPRAAQTKEAEKITK